MTALSDLLAAARGDRSVDQLIADAERRTGEQIPDTARSTIYKALKGEHAKSPRDETLQLFALVFGLSVMDVRSAAGKPRGALGPWVPVSESAQLSKEQRDALDNLIKTITRGGERHDSAAATKLPDSGPGNVKRLSVPRDEVDLAEAADDPGTSTAGEQEHADEP